MAASILVLCASQAVSLSVESDYAGVQVKAVRAISATSTGFIDHGKDHEQAWTVTSCAVSSVQSDHYPLPATRNLTEAKPLNLTSWRREYLTTSASLSAIAISLDKTKWKYIAPLRMPLRLASSDGSTPMVYIEGSHDALPDSMTWRHNSMHDSSPVCPPSYCLFPKASLAPNLPNEACGTASGSEQQVSTRLFGQLDQIDVTNLVAKYDTLKIWLMRQDVGGSMPVREPVKVFAPAVHSFISVGFP